MNTMTNTKNTLLRQIARWFGVVMLLIAASTHAEEVTYYHHDALGSTVAATDENGNLLWKEAYRPYGERIRQEDANTNDIWYTGKPHEEEIGLSYFGARWYDPATGRFMAIDPVGVKEENIHSFNRYAYANNNPYKFVDPDGRHPIIYVIGKELVAYGIESFAGVPLTTKSVGKKISREITKRETKQEVTTSGAKTDTLQPGPFARESIPGHRGRPTAEEQRQVNDLMKKHGCHTCGTKEAGTKSGNAIADHQPPQALGEPKAFLPHCNHCKARQGGQVLQEKRRREK